MGSPELHLGLVMHAEYGWKKARKKRRYYLSHGSYNRLSLFGKVPSKRMMIMTCLIRLCCAQQQKKFFSNCTIYIFKTRFNLRSGYVQKKKH